MRIFWRRIFVSVFTVMVVTGSGCAGQADEAPLHILIEERAVSIEDETGLDTLIEKASDKRLVLLGESSHGTEEFYNIRAEISRRLISEAGFNFIVVEGDWHPFCLVNRFVKGSGEYQGGTEKLLRENFNRWPPWMWANSSIVGLVDWLAEYNKDKPASQKAGLYGMDVYGQWQSMRAVQKYMKESGLERLVEAASNYDCFADYNYDEWAYARAVMDGAEPCDGKVGRVVDILRGKKGILSERSRYNYFSAKQNAIVMRNAELYYRTAGLRGPEGWNNRVMHMKETVSRLLDFYGEGARAIIWAHNTHIGDARATSMALQGQVNIGQLAREKYGPDNVYLVGFATHRGRVMAGRRWGVPGEVMTVPEGSPASVEDIFNMVSYPSYMVHFDKELGSKLQRVLRHRAIGVVYNPAQEAGNYVPTFLARRYDSFIFIGETNPVKPLNGQEKSVDNEE